MGTTEAKKQRLLEEQLAAEKEIEELENAKEKLYDSGLKREFQRQRSELKDSIYALKRQVEPMSKMAKDIVKVKGWKYEFPPADGILIAWMAAGYGVRAIQWFYEEKEK